VRSPDVVVIGAGIVGCSAAAELARRGARVHVVDAAGVAAAASGRNSGAVWWPADPVLDVLYRESLEGYRALAETEAAREAGFELPKAPVGILTLSRDPVTTRAAVTHWQATRPWLGATYVDERALPSLEPAVAPGLVACRLDIGYPVAPASATRAWAAAATRAGATFEVAEAALELDGDRLRGIRAAGRRIDAAAVVVAAGPWTPAIVDPSGAWRPIRPFWGVVVEIQLAQPPRQILEGAGIEDAIDPGQLRAARRPDEADGIVDFSLVTAMGRSTLGSTFLPFEPDPADYLERLIATGAGYVPEIGRAPVRGRRACARPLSVDGRPLVGAVPGVDGLFVAAGHGPWGISTGPASGCHVAALVMGDGNGVPVAIREAVSPARFARPQPEDTR